MLKKLLVPLDGSKLAEQALPYAKTLAKKHEAELMLIRILPPFVVIPELQQTDYSGSDMLPRIEKEARSYLTGKQQELLADDLPTRIEIVEGGPVAEMILELAREREADLIVMSTHGYSGNELWAYGSVANKVLQRAPCPIFLVRGQQEST